MKNVIELMQESYQTGTQPSKQEEQDAAMAVTKEQSLWQQWTQIPITDTFIKNTQAEMSKLITESFAGVLAGVITDAQLRAKITQAATLARVCAIATTNQGKY